MRPTALQPIAEAGAQFAQRFMHIGAGRGLATPKIDGDIRVIHLVILPQDQCHPLFGGQGIDEPLHFFQEPARIELRGLINRRRRDRRLVVERVDPVELPPGAQKRVRSDAIEPGTVVGVAVQPVEGAKRLQERLLVQIISIGAVPGQLLRVRVQLFALAMEIGF